MQSVASVDDASQRCADFIRERCGVIIHALRARIDGNLIRIDGQIGSWHGKQLASEAARQLFPGMQIDNQLTVIKPR